MEWLLHGIVPSSKDALGGFVSLILLPFFFIAGALVGTFLTTCIERLPFEENGIFDEEEPEEWYYNIPMLGLFFAMPLYTRFKALIPATALSSSFSRTLKGT